MNKVFFESLILISLGIIISHTTFTELEFKNIKLVKGE